MRRPLPERTGYTTANPFEWTHRFLAEVERLLPPPEGTHHSLTAQHYGNDETGWKPELTFQLVMRSEGKFSFANYFLRLDDVRNTPEQTAAELVEFIRNDLLFTKGETELWSPTLLTMNTTKDPSTQTSK